MKKIFTLTALLLGMAIGVNAQGKKTWAFQEDGLSPETIEALDADEANWTKEGTDDAGNTTGWKEATKHTGAFKANGAIIPELAGLELVNSGLSSNNNVIIRKDRVRLNRNNMKFKLPRLANGQTITIVCQSANGSATDRGVKASYDYMQRIEGPEDNIIPGSAGMVTNKWQVVTDATDSVDIEFTMITGGIDFRLIMIDEGDVPQVLKVNYLSDGSGDLVSNYLAGRENTELTVTDVNSATFTAEDLQQYDVTIVGPAVTANSAAAGVVQAALPWTPVLNLNGSLYAAWGYGEVQPSVGFLKIVDMKNKLFKDVPYEETEEGNVIVLSQDAFSTSIDMVVPGDYFAGDAIPATPLNLDGETEGEAQVAAIHTHNINHNGYIYLPYAADYTEAALKLIDNAATILADSKREITPASAPSLTREYKDMLTLVTIKAPALPKAKVYYTTDGSEPTVESTLYEGTIALAQPCTVKAVAIAEGYTLSQPAEIEVLIKKQPATPTISYEIEDGQTTIRLACANEDVKIWYNFDNVVDTTKSSVYVDSIPVIIKMPQDVVAFATTLDSIPTEVVFSEKATQRVLVKNPRVVIDVAGHFAANKWDDVAAGNGIFSNGKSATTMYDTSQDPIGYTYNDDGDEIAVYPEVEWMVRDEPGDDPQWQVMTKGQSMLWQNLDLKTDQIGTNEGGYYPSVAEDIDPLFSGTKNDIQFYNIFTGENPNGAIQSKNKYQAPLDIVVIANMQGGPLLAQVSPDGENWVTVGDEIEKTGYSRMWKKYTRMYEGNDEVYIRVTQQTGTSGAKVFDIFVANQGENSQALLDQLKQEYDAFVQGIDDAQHKVKTVQAGIYSLNGVRRQALQPGLNIVVYTDGTVRKVAVK